MLHSIVWYQWERRTTTWKWLKKWSCTICGSMCCCHPLLMLLSGCACALSISSSKTSSLQLPWVMHFATGFLSSSVCVVVTACAPCNVAIIIHQFTKAFWVYVGRMCHVYIKIDRGGKVRESHERKWKLQLLLGKMCEDKVKARADFTIAVTLMTCAFIGSLFLRQYDS